MSLKVWLPLNGDLHNQGTSAYNITAIETTPTFTVGKIGQCYQRANTNSQITNGLKIEDNLLGLLGSTASVAVWVKPLGTHTHYNGTILSSGNWNAKRWAFGVKQNNSQVDVLCGGYNNYIPCSVPVNEWTHLVSTYDNGVCTLYKNGIYVGQITGQAAFNSDADWTGICRETYAGGYFGFNGCINDLRIYDHALSAAEVKEISQGLILHYKLNQPIGLTDAILNQDTYIVYNNYSGSGTTGTLTNLSETFNGHVVRREVMIPNDTSVNNFKTSLGSHGVYGHRQTFLANTKYVFWIYYRPISHTDIRAGGTASNIGGWTEIPPVAVGNGWYRVGQYRNGTVTTDKTDNIFTSFYTPTAASGVPITVDWAAPHLLVGTTEIPDDDLFMGNDYVKDSSGYNHNGTITGNITLNSNTPRYSASSFFNGTERITTTTPGADIRTLSCWCKTTKNKSTSQQMVADSFSNMTISFYNGTIIGVFGTTRGTGSKCTLGDSYKENDWNHIVVVKTNDAGARDIYCNGVKLTPTSNDYWSAATGFFVGARNTSNGNPFYGQISDVRAYCTALSADDILQLYHTSAKIDNNHNFHTFELVEKNQNKISINKRGQTLCEEIIEDTTTKFYKNTKIIKTKQLIEI